jgi:hypothetical protein
MNDYNLILNQIEEIRRKNNKSWMKLVRTAFEFAPDEAKIIIEEIVAGDKEITSLCEKLIKNNLFS